MAMRAHQQWGSILSDGRVGQTGRTRRNAAAAHAAEARALLPRSAASRSTGVAAPSDEHGAARLEALLTCVPDGVLSLDVAGTITAANDAWEALSGASAEWLVGRRLTALAAGAAESSHTDRQLDLVLRGETRSWRITVARRDGTSVRLTLTAAPVLAEGDVVGIEAVARDVTRQQALEERLAREAQHDPLTGLANRVLFRERVERALLRAAEWSPPPSSGEGAQASPPDAAQPAASGPTPGRHVAVLFIDLDDFKTINDSLGHAEGDRLLEEVAARLLKATRGFDLVARLGGDEFGVLLDGMMRETDARSVVDRITASLARPVSLGHRELMVGASLGVAHARDARNADELLRNADVAMYHAKTAGKGRHAEFDHAMHAAAVARLELAGDLRHAVDRGELRLTYQPVVELTTGRIVGAEALLRWNRPGHGAVAPLAFIPVAEETGLIVPIGRWVLREACAQLARWRATLPDAESLTMNVNVSARQLEQRAFVEEVRSALEDTGLPASKLALEITESVLVQHGDATLATLHALKSLGITLAIDDFGTGYSSLGYLQRFPVDVLKIDRAFVDGVTRGGSNAALARTIVALGDALGLRAVAEGVEQVGQQEALASLGCQLGQGYLFARPLEVAAFEKHFAAQRRGTPPG